MKSTHKKSKGGKRPGPGQVSATTNRINLAPDRWLVPVIVALLIGVAFLPTLQNGFVVWDDDQNFILNPNYRGLGLDELRWMFTAFHMGHYIPLTWLTLGLDYLLWGMDPAGYHLTNLLLHVATAIAFYFLTIRLLRLATGSEGEDKALWVGAAFAALIFAVHPLRVESVAWITERRDVLSGLFYILTILAYLRAIDRVTRSARWHWISVVLFACALLSKSMAVSLPVVLLILDVYPLRRLGGPVGWWNAGARRVYTEKVPFVLLAGVASVVAFVALSYSPAMASLDKMSTLDRLIISGYSLGFYLWKTVAPLNLSPMYELPIKIDPWSTPFILSNTLVLIFIVLTFVLRHKLPGMLAAWLAYVVILLPVIGIVQNGPQIAADRYTYLSCLGWAVLAGAGMFYCWRPLVRRRIGLRTFVLINGVAVMVVVGLGGLTWKQTQVWHDYERLWRQVISVDPESKIAHNNLGNAMGKRGELGEAIKHYQEAVRIDPAYVNAVFNLGSAMSKRGELGEAIKYYRQALRINPAYAEAHYNLGKAMSKRGELGEAIKHYQDAVGINPDFMEAHFNLGNAMINQGELEEAIKHYRQVLRIKPDYAHAYNNLGAAFFKGGRLAEAAEQFCQSLRLGYAQALKNLTVALARLGEKEDAVERCRKP